MATEAFIRKKALEVLDKEKWVYWYPARVKFKQNDIFGVFDLVCCRQNSGSLKFIQLTTASNLSARRKKIQTFLRENKINKKKTILEAEMEIWAWRDNKKDFKVETI